VDGLRMVPLFLLILVTISKSENKKSARSLRFIDCPETMVTKSCLRNVRSVAAKCISPSIKDSICSSSILSFSVQLIFTAISCTCFCDSISDSWSGCVGSVCFNSVWIKQSKNTYRYKYELPTICTRGFQVVHGPED